MGEAKRRKKLDPHFGQNYPALEENWVFTSASDQIAIGNLNDCLRMAGITTTPQYKSTYIDPLLDPSKSKLEKLDLLNALYLSRARIKDQLYKSLFEKAVREGEIYIDVNQNREGKFDSEEIDIEEELDEEEKLYEHIMYNPKRVRFFLENGY